MTEPVPTESPFDSPFDSALLHALAGDYLSGAATPENVARLEALLAAHPTARAAFVSLALIHGQLAATLVAAGAGSDMPGELPAGADTFGAALADGGGARGTQAAQWAQWTQGSRGVEPMPGPQRAWATAGTLSGTAAGTAAVTVAGAALLAATVAAVLLVPGSQRAGSAYDQRQLPLLTVATLADAAPGAEPRTTPTRLTPTTLRPRQSTSLTSSSGAAVEVPGAAVFGLASGESGVLYDGSVEARLVEPDASFSVTAANLRIVDKGTAFRVDRIDADHVRVTCTDGEVEVQSRVRLPVCYWSFDDVAAGRPWAAVDVVSGLVGTFQGSAAIAPGIVGRAAARFDNQRDSVVTIAGGSGDSVGTGLLAAADGITIEALILSRWSGRFKDYDEIYRKEDGDCRVLLSFQNDGGNYGGFSEPAVAEGPCLSFGLHLAGRGYRELDMPLDGRDGRPTLAEIADGRPHHVVASYDSFTGRKAIFIDGRLRYAHDYPVGTMILSGGPVAATIGNHGCCEPFTGAIDELAIYDFALTPREVEEHHAHVRQGSSPFGGEPPAAGGPRWQAVTRLVAGESQAFNQHTGLPVAAPRDELD